MDVDGTDDDVDDDGTDDDYDDDDDADDDDDYEWCERWMILKWEKFAGGCSFLVAATIYPTDK